jgi:hypothetical protein
MNSGVSTGNAPMRLGDRGDGHAGHGCTLSPVLTACSNMALMKMKNASTSPGIYLAIRSM